MGLETDQAALRIMLRAMTPTLRGVFESAEKQSLEPAYNWRLIMGYKENGDFNNPKNNRMILRSFVTGATAIAQFNPDHTPDPSQENSLNDMFPVLAGIIADCAEEWKTTPFHVLIYLRLVPPAGPGKKETMELKAMEKKSKTNPDQVRREFIL